MQQSLRPFFLLLGLFLSLPALSQDIASGDRRYVVDIELQGAGEFEQLLERAEQLLEDGVDIAAGEARVTFVLHGPVLTNLLRQNYLDNKRLVNLAAALTAMDVIDVKACRTWMKANGLDSQQLQPFVETVNYGPAVVERLIQEESHLYF